MDYKLILDILNLDNKTNQCFYSVYIALLLILPTLYRFIFSNECFRVFKEKKNWLCALFSGFLVALFGLGFGYVIGMTSAPVMATLVSGILGASGIIAFYLKFSKSIASYKFFTLMCLSLLLISWIMGANLGISCRTNHVFGISYDTRKKDLINYYHLLGFNTETSGDVFIPPIKDASEFVKTVKAINGNFDDKEILKYFIKMAYPSVDINSNTSRRNNDKSDDATLKNEDIQNRERR